MADIETNIKAALTRLGQAIHEVELGGLDIQDVVDETLQELTPAVSLTLQYDNAKAG